MIDLGGLQLAHPVLNASGTLDARSAHAVLGDATLGCAAHVTKTITPEPRAGNAAPRIAEVPGGMINSIGLPGPGIDRFCAEVLPATAAIVDVPIVVSVGGFSPDDYVRLVERLTEIDAVAALELNLSCPNVKSGCISIGTDPRETEAVTAQVRARTTRPLLVKLSPSVADVAELARAAEAGGADALTLTNTARGMVLNRCTGAPLLGAGTGGVSGPGAPPAGARRRRGGARARSRSRWSAWAASRRPTTPATSCRSAPRRWRSARRSSSTPRTPRASATAWPALAVTLPRVFVRLPCWGLTPKLRVRGQTPTTFRRAEGARVARPRRFSRSVSARSARSA